MEPDPSLGEFRQAVLEPDAGIDLGRAALLIARIEYPDLDLSRYLARLDRLADGVQRQGSDPDPRSRLDRLRGFLFETEGFAGNGEDYFDPRNSFLNDVLDRRVGIPITLSLVVMEIGRRLGLQIEGIGLPGHFVVGFPTDNGRVVFDPFHGGALLTREQCREVVSRVLGRPVTLSQDDFDPVTKRQFLARMLRNLKAIYWRRQDWRKALPVMERLVAVEPEQIEERRDRGLVLAEVGELRRAIADWETYLSRSPQGSDANAVRAHLRRARHALAALN